MKNAENSTSNTMQHKLIKRKPHEVQLTLTNQNFNFISNENEVEINSRVKLNQNTKNEDSDSSYIKKVNDKYFNKNGKKIRISDLSNNCIDIENLIEISKKSFVNTSNNKSNASYSNSIILKDKLSKTRSTSEHNLVSKKLNDFSYHSYSYSHININRLNILSNKKSICHIKSINDSSKKNQITKAEVSNIFNKFKNYNNSFKELASNTAKKKSDENIIKNNNIYEINSDSTKLTNKNHFNNINFNKDSYKNRYAYLNSINISNSKPKNNVDAITSKNRINILNKNTSSAKLGNFIGFSEKIDRYNRNITTNYYNENTSKIYQRKKIAYKNSSNDFHTNNYLVSKVNKTNSKTNILNFSKEKDSYSINTNEQKTLTNQAFSIRSYTNEYKNNISKKEKNLISSKEKILKINKVYKNRIAGKIEKEIPSSRTHKNFESNEFSQIEKSPPLISKNSKLISNLNAEKEIIFNEYENLHLDTEENDTENKEFTDKNFFSNSFTFDREKRKLNLSEQKSKSEKSMQLAFLPNKFKNNISKNKETSNNTYQNTITDNKSNKTDNSNIQTKRDSDISNNLKHQIKNTQIFTNNKNNILIYKKKTNNEIKSKNKYSNNNLIDLNDSKNNFEYNQTCLNTHASVNQPGILTSNFITKSNKNGNNSKNLIGSNITNNLKTRTLIDKKSNNISGHHTNIANLNITKEKILEFNNNYNQSTQQNPVPTQTPNHNYQKSINTQIGHSTNIRNNNDKIANKITQILSLQNKKSGSMKPTHCRTPNNNRKNFNCKIKGISPKSKGIINLNFENDSITNSIFNNTGVNINLNYDLYSNTGNMDKDYIKENNFLERNVLITQNSIASADKSTLKNNKFINDEFDSENNYKINLNSNSANLNKHIFNGNKNIHKANNQNNFNNIYTTIKKLTSADTDELITNKNFNSINYSKSKEKNKKLNLNFHKYHNITKEKVKNIKKEKFKKYPTLQDRNKDYMLLQDEFSYFHKIENNNNSISIPDNPNNENNKRNDNKLFKQGDFNTNNNYIHTTDDEEIIELNNNSKVLRQEIDFLNENFNENSVDFNQDMNNLNFNTENNFSQIFKNQNNPQYKNSHTIKTDPQEYNFNNMYTDDKSINRYDKHEIEYEEQFLETNNSINTLKYINKNSNNIGKKITSLNKFKNSSKISPIQKQTIETCEGIFLYNDIPQNKIISENLNSNNYKIANIDTFHINEHGSNINNYNKKSQKSNSRSNNIKDNISGNSNNLNTEASGNNNNRIIEKNIKNLTNASNNQVMHMQHNTKEKNISKNSNHIKNSNSKEISNLNSGKKISPNNDKKNYDSNINNKPNNLNMKFNYIDLSIKNNKKGLNSQFINTNVTSKEKMNDKIKHNFININYTK